MKANIRRRAAETPEIYLRRDLQNSEYKKSLTLHSACNMQHVTQRNENRNRGKSEKN